MYSRIEVFLSNNSSSTTKNVIRGYGNSHDNTGHNTISLFMHYHHFNTSFCGKTSVLYAYCICWLLDIVLYYVAESVLVWCFCWYIAAERIQSGAKHPHLQITQSKRLCFACVRVKCAKRKACAF